MPVIDLSTTISPTPDDVPEYQKIGIRYFSHADGAADIEKLFGVSPDLLRDGEGWATEIITHLGTHSSTHVDAPWHYNSSIRGERAQTIDELPLEWFFSDGVKLDMTAKADGDTVDVEDLERELARVGYTLKPLDIVLIQTGRDRFRDEPDYLFRGCGVTAPATRWLFDRGVRVTGIDAWGWDRPLNLQAEEALSGNRKGVFWEAHQVDLPYCHMERLTNLDQVPSFGFKIACFPLKIKGGSAAPARVVAILPE